LIHYNFDFRATSEFESLLSFNVLSLNLSKQVEVRVQFLRFILVGMNTSFVMIDGFVLPLWNWLDIKELHEIVKFDFII